MLSHLLKRESELPGWCQKCLPASYPSSAINYEIGAKGHLNGNNT